MNKNKIKKIFNKVSLTALFAFSLPFVVHGSSFDVSKKMHDHRYSRGETGHIEVDHIMEKVVLQPSFPLLSLFYDRVGTSLSGQALEISDRIDAIKNLMR
ncbi:hypothetical protein [Simkania negevensis]|uniref:Secreted protein n=1 Tax=Simkania negevensis (strain ATCC VR-1471 / DSM 27360 / Z) TaxID=331113 RepID=F8L8F4_SIMNZ|nr:hypothetical protein [Simkania negevensis]MCB1068426.1 hypothetical protein [Simkania sp.]MCB1074231.1 hypothetical protein [Simkania sp.]CCB89077.1 unknown protein [Simkania negevensis Z]